MASSGLKTTSVINWKLRSTKLLDPTSASAFASTIRILTSVMYSKHVPTLGEKAKSHVSQRDISSLGEKNKN